ncbi:unnamed protein product [[Candida] boidinii]|nr:unnamed protein product [[Candida] boidinii]
MAQELDEDEGMLNYETYTQSVKLYEMYGTLPSISDWDNRIKLLKMFYPKMNIDNISIKYENLSRNNNKKKRIKIIKFNLNFRKFYEFSLILNVDNNSEEILSLEINLINGLTHELSEIQSLIAYCESNKDITLFIYSINSYIKYLNFRISIWIKLFKKYVIDSNTNIKFVELFDDNKSNSTSSNSNLNSYQIQNNLNLFLKFKNRNQLKLSNDKNNTIIINWNLLWDFKDSINSNGDCLSKIDCYFVRRHNPNNNNNNNNSQKQSIIDLDDTINDLISIEGVFKSFCNIIDNSLL